MEEKPRCGSEPHLLLMAIKVDTLIATMKQDPDYSTIYKQCEFEFLFFRDQTEEFFYRFGRAV